MNKTTIHQEQLEALGFKDQADYDAHQQLLARVEKLHKETGYIVADGPWCLIQR